MKGRMRALLHVAEHLLLALAVTALALLLAAPFWLQDTDYPVKCDAMAVLGGDFQRAAYAGELYQQGMARTVYVGRVARWPGEKVLDDNAVPFPRREDLYKALLVRKGVPGDAIEYFGQRLESTVLEAEALAERLKGRTGSLMVVTSPYHALRARMIFSRALPGWDVRVVGAPGERLPAAWWSGRESARAVLMEIPKTVFYLLGGRFAPEQAKTE